MRRNFLLFLTALLCSSTIGIAQTHTNYITATGENGYSLTASITAPADDTQLLGGDPIPSNWTVTGTIHIPGGDFVNFTKDNIQEIMYIYSGENFSNPGMVSDINFFEFEALSNEGSLYSGQGISAFNFSFATGSWESNFNGLKNNVKGEIYNSIMTSKGFVDTLIITDSPDPATSVPLTPWTIVIVSILLGAATMYQMKKSSTV